MITFTFPQFSNPFSAMVWLFTHGGFIGVMAAFASGAFWLYMEAIQTRYLSKIQYVLLAIDVPKENEQTPKAVEHIFSHFHGIHRNPNKLEKYRDGFVMPSLSIELVTIGGYIQYLIRTPVNFRDMIEAAIYAQYPNAEISEVEDYATRVEAKFPNDSYDMWGAELTLVTNQVYPIRTYPLWEHSLTQTFLDPMASLLEMMGRIRSGEQIWLQWVISPTPDDGWRKKGLVVINKLIGLKGANKKSTLDDLLAAPGNLATGAYQTLTRTLFEPSQTTQREKDEPPSLMQHLAPNVRVVVEAIGMKISKLGFDVKCRLVYLGQKDEFDRSRISGMFGALKQYQGLDMNGFRPDQKMKTARVFFRPRQRENGLKRRILLGYTYRSNWRGRAKFVLNVEELASLWHFPVLTVKAPLVKKTEAKRGEPPVALPVGDETEYLPEKAKIPAHAPGPGSTSPVPGAPTNLPVG